MGRHGSFAIFSVNVYDVCTSDDGTPFADAINAVLSLPLGEREESEGNKMVTPTQPAKKRRSIRPYLRTPPGKFNMSYFLLGIGWSLWAPIVILFFGAPMNGPVLAIIIGSGIAVVALSVSNFSKNRTIKP